MREHAPAVRSDLSPNQLARREEIVLATMQVLATQGLAACTVREVAAAGPLTKSAVHYYFADFDRLVDIAMGRHVEAFVHDLSESVAFWGVVDSYLDTFFSRPEVTRLWLEYWAATDRSGRAEAVGQMNDRVIGLLASRLGELDVDGADEVARDVFAVLLGQLLMGLADTGAVDDCRRRVGLMSGLPVPKHQGRSG